MKAKPEYVEGPEAATRFAWNNTPRSVDAWFCGQLQGTNGSTLAYDDKHVSANLPIGTLLTPGVIAKKVNKKFFSTIAE